MNKARVQQRLRERILAKTKLEQTKNSDRARTQKFVAAEEFQDEGTNDISRAIDIVANASFVEPVPTPLPNEIQRNDVPKAPAKYPKHVSNSVSSSPSITLGRSMDTSVTLNEADEKRLLEMNIVSRSRELIDFASQVFLSSREQIAASKIELDQLSKVEKVSNGAKNKVTIEHHKVVAAMEAELKKYKADSVAREGQLREKISTLEKQLQEIEHGKLYL